MQFLFFLGIVPGTVTAFLHAKLSKGSGTPLWVVHCTCWGAILIVLWVLALLLRWSP